jgi:peptidoglycan/xylan/chitin deacetylase (PgdA/CDA1 family)
MIGRCISVHAERLERDDVWRRTDAFLHRLERSGGRATVFVHPRSAIATGADLGPRIRALLERGHEIGQHTHFYADEEEEGKPLSDFSADGVRRCLERDHRLLCNAGAEPRGFVAGAWAIVDAVGPWLRGHGFAYDASVRAFPLSYKSDTTSRGDGWNAAEKEDGIVQLPTTAPVSAILRGRLRRARVGDVEYELLYVHDHDLLRARSRAATAALLATGRHVRWTTAAELAARAVNERAMP